MTTLVDAEEAMAHLNLTTGDDRSLVVGYARAAQIKSGTSGRYRR